MGVSMSELLTLDEATRLIGSGTPLLIAGDALLLAELPKGQWIGGTTPYFMTSHQGGITDRERVCVTRLEQPVTAASVRVYSEQELRDIPGDYPQHGCSFIILPAGSDAHLHFARECVNWPGLFNSPLVGWNAGVHLDEVNRCVPRVFDGSTQQSFENAAVVLHATTEQRIVSRIEIVNPFHPDQGDLLSFPSTGFYVTECLVNGVPTNLCEYIEQRRIDTRWPLVADFSGAHINVSFQNVDDHRRVVRFYSPVFEGVEYRVAAPVSDLDQVFGREFDARKTKPAFCCNCILNFLHAELEGKRTGEATGPFTFGEIAYLQLNQTLVYVTFEDAS